MVIKASISELNKATAEAVASRGDIVIEAWTKYADIFDKAIPDVATLTAKNDMLKKAILDYETMGGGKVLAATVIAQRLDMVGLLRLGASYVTSRANGNMEILLKGGFPIQKPTRTPIGPLPAPNAPYVTQGPNTGTARATTTPLYGGQSYNWRVALASAPTVYVQTAQTTAASKLFTGLTAGEIYNIQVNVVGAAGTSDFSEIGTLMVI